MAKKTSKRQSRTQKGEPEIVKCFEAKCDGKVERFPFHKYLTYEEMDEVHGATMTIEEMYSRAKQRKEAGAPVLLNVAKRKAYDDAMVKAIKLRMKSQQKLEKWEARGATKATKRGQVM